MKLYIHLRFQPYPMVCLPGNAQIRYIHLRFRLNPMVHLPETLKFTTSIYAISHIRWRICSETLKFATSICALGQIRWNARIYSAKSDGAPAYTRLNPMERPLFTKKLPAPGTPEPEARLLTVSYILIHYLRSIPQFSKASVISPCAMTLLSPRTTVPLAAASSNIST